MNELSPSYRAGRALRSARSRPLFPLVIAAWLALAAPLAGQFNDEDPFASAYRIAASDEAFILVAPITGGQVTMRIIDANGSVGNGLVAGPENVVGGYRDREGMTSTTQEAGLDAAALDLDGDRKDEVVAIWEGENREVVLAFPRINPTNMSISSVATYKMSDWGFPLLHENEETEVHRNMRLIPAQLDKDRKGEFVVAWWAEDNSVQLVAMEVDDNGNPVVLGSIHDVSIVSDTGTSRAVGRTNRFALCAGEFDQDYGDEIMLVYPQLTYPGGGLFNSNWTLYVRAYKLTGDTGSQTLVAAATSAPLYSSNLQATYGINRISAAAGDFDGDALDEGVVGITMVDPGGSQPTKMGVIYFEADENLENFGPMPGNFIFVEQTNNEYGFPMSVSTGDYNNDEFTDVGYFSRQGPKAFTKWNGSNYYENGQYSLTSGSSTTYPAEDHHRVISVSDMDADADTDFEGELLYFTSREKKDGGSVVAYDAVLSVLQPDTSYQVVTDWSETFNTDRIPNLAMVTGDFDGDSVQLGKPTIYRYSEIVQPIMILNAPPIHYDVIDGVNYDVNKCYYNDDPLINCGATATYTLQNTVVQEISTEINADWSVSTGIEESVEAEVAGVRGKMTSSLDHKFGQGFSKSRNSGTTITETKQFIAEADDLIYAAVADYDVLEYPVMRNGQSLGSIVSVVPKEPRLITFNSKSPRAASYVSPHEPGNILSYRSEASEATNPLVDRPVNQFTGFIWEMQPNGNSQWTLQLSNFSQDALSNRSSESISARDEVEYEVGGEIPILDDLSLSFSAGVKAYLQNDYSHSTVSTTSTTLTTEHTLNVNFGNIDGSILGNTTYEVLPYIYWAKNGALVLDYAVNPVLGDSVEGFWQVHYGHKPDLAFTMLSRYDKNKGLNITDLEATRTHNIQVNPVNPRSGDTVDIFARIHNYSIQPSNSPESVVRFYLGDPDSGGILLMDKDGKTDIRIPPIAPRSYRIVALRGWVVPWHVQHGDRLFAVIDPNNTVDEIHEDNNKGWAPLNAFGGSLWPKASTYTSGWADSPWMGWLQQDDFPYVYHLNMGYIYPASFSSPGSITYWDFAIGSWCWTTPTYWPYIYFYSKIPGWNYYYQVTSAPNRWYLNIDSGNYVVEDQLSP